MLGSEVEVGHHGVSPWADREALRLVELAEIVEEDRLVAHIAVVPPGKVVDGDARLADLWQVGDGSPVAVDGDAGPGVDVVAEREGGEEEGDAAVRAVLLQGGLEEREVAVLVHGHIEGVVVALPHHMGPRLDEPAVEDAAVVDEVVDVGSGELGEDGFEVGRLLAGGEVLGEA